MRPGTLINADYLDIIYDKRNKNYGGYELRRHYDQRLRKAAVLALTGVAVILSLSFIISNRADRSNVPPVLHESKVSEVVIPVQPIDKPKVIPPPPAPAQHIKTRLFTDPVIVSNELVPPDKQMAENKDVANAHPGLANEDGDSIGLAPGLDKGTGTGVVETNNGKSNEPVRFVEQMPQFAGDMERYLNDNIHYPELARSTGIEGKVAIEFIVNEDGSVSNAKVVRGIGGGCDEEALRIVNNMPKWKPGKQNGIAVKVLFVLPILFQLN